LDGGKRDRCAALRLLGRPQEGKIWYREKGKEVENHFFARGGYGKEPHHGWEMSRGGGKGFLVLLSSIRGGGGEKRGGEGNFSYFAEKRVAACDGGDFRK